MLFPLLTNVERVLEATKRNGKKVTLTSCRFARIVCSRFSVDAFEQTEVYEDPSFKEGAAAFQRFDK